MEGAGQSEARSFDRALLEAITRANTAFHGCGDTGQAFGELLAVVLELTGSGYGFIGEVLHAEDGAPFLRCHAITDISWDEASRAFYRDHMPEGFEFRHLASLYGAVMTSGEAVLANDPATDPRRRGLPSGHPPLDAFMGLPFTSGEEVIGMIGVANRAGGYDAALVEALEPLLATCASLVLGHRTRRQRLQTSDALRSEQERVRLALAASGLGTFDHDLVTDRIGWSAETGRIFGFPDDLREAPLARWASHIPPDELARVQGIACRRAAEAGDELPPLEHEIVRPGGERRWVSVHGTFATSADGRRLRLLGVIKDITDERKLRTRLMLADRMAAVGTLAAGVGHEINNPLAYVAGNLRMVIPELEEMRHRGVQPGDPRLELLREMIEDAVVGADRIAEIVRQLRTFSRNDDVPRPVDLTAVVRSAAAMASSQIRPRARLVVELGDVPPVTGKVGPLSQVLLNLLINAAQAIEPGAVDKNEIAVTARVRDGHVVLEIRDTGVGIPPDVLPRIFDPFFTTKEVGGGTGLGLAVSRQIAADHGGELRVDSAPGQGTRVELILPIEPARAPGAGRAPAPRAPEVRVLVVDDEPLIGRLIARLLEPGATTDVATSALEARARLAAGAYDVVLCDLLMPGESVMALYDEVCRERATLAGRFVFMSGGTYTADARDFVARDGILVIEKPLDPATLVATVRDVAATAAVRAAGR